MRHNVVGVESKTCDKRTNGIRSHVSRFDNCQKLFKCLQLMTLDCVLTDHLLRLVTGPCSPVGPKRCAVDLGDNQTLL